jgi:hypothetical protein
MNPGLLFRLPLRHAITGQHLAFCFKFGLFCHKKGHEFKFKYNSWATFWAIFFRQNIWSPCRSKTTEIAGKNSCETESAKRDKDD